ncbi:hypothetical protein V2G26_020603 [Clonostachys chloroleuca]|uniref:PCI domain-containing protein n=1 Tax=Clonostachys chloroleuca TaxID=1926264 RepID=A0AA35PXW4_9HYPO|nr:unnamed protein product [Clonostachys chloroleuca]
MGPSSDLLAFFSRMKSQGAIIVEDLPKFDVESYISNYQGRTRFDRLMLLGESSVPLCVDALKAAVVEAKNGRDVGRYRGAWEYIRVAAPNEPEAIRDNAWIESTETANKAETARLEVELKGYRNNLIKESIRMGNEDLGTHLEETGHLKEAAEAYGRMRHDVGTTKHIVDCAQHLVSVALQRRDWVSVISNASKVSGLQATDLERDLQPYLKAVSGIGQLGLGKYHEAAASFLQINSAGSLESLQGLITSNDIAIYGGLLALATMDRKDLQTKVLDNPTFRTFLEHEPHVRKAISQFINGRYSTCLSTLEVLQTDCLLDLYMQKHVATIFTRIRRKCIVQYFIPFSCVTIQSLDEAFGRGGNSIEDELASMIRDGALSARIDSKSKLLVAVSTDPRAKMQAKALNVARKYEHEAKERLRRINVIASGLEVTRGKRQTDEHWYEGERTSVLTG